MFISAVKNVEFDYEPHEYRSLRQDREEIRLLVLLPDPPPLALGQTRLPFPTGEQPVYCHLATFPLSSAPSYVAVSYTWATEDGDSRKSQPLIICPEHADGGKTVIWITTNCANTLRQVRARSKIDVVWVDAVCINQDQISERNYQVGMMDRIYKRAKRVDICISDPLQNFSAAVELLIDKTGVLKELELAGDTAHVRQAAFKWEPLFNLRYFGRVWV
jgi:hypothetical protein